VKLQLDARRGDPRQGVRDYRRNRFVIGTMAFLPLLFIAYRSCSCSPSQHR